MKPESTIGAGWSGGQYSLFRFLFGSYLFVHFVQLLPWARELFSSDGMVPMATDSPLMFVFPNILGALDAPLFVSLFLASGAAAALAFAAGWRDKWAALWCWYVLACLFGRNPFIQNPSLPYVGWMLLAHLFIPSAPYGSLDARGRSDPGGGWRMPAQVMLAAWLVMALSYTYSGYTKLLSASWRDGSMLGYVLQNPLARDGWLRDFILSLPAGFLETITLFILWVEFLFVLGLFSRRTRPWFWGAMLLVQFGFALLLNFADLTLAMLLFHLFTLEPEWFAAQRPAHPEHVYYDGRCGLCHGVVRFLLAEDRHGDFFYSPQQGARFAALQLQGLPDSFVVLRDDGAVLTKSTAALHVARRLGGLWRVLGMLVGLLPRRLLDAAYDFIARNRRRWFAPPQQICPMAAAPLQARFIA